jgi:hypothetical protein
MSNPKTIYFYEEYGEHGYFSNYAACPIFLKSRLWPTTEHYYQAQKYADTELEELVRQQPAPHNAKELTRNPRYPARADWNTVRDRVMRTALYAKFSQHEHLRQALLATGNTVLVEHTDKDAYWGDGGDGSGTNMLGKLLMHVREQLRHEAEWRFGT